MTQPVKEKIQQWLDEAAAAMGGDRDRRRDVLLELETTIYDRVDERERAGQVPEDAVSDVLEMMGDPAKLGASFLPSQALVAPHQTRAFRMHVGIVFAIHFLLVIGATMAGHAFALPPLRIQPIAEARNVLEVCARAISTLLFDAGLVLCAFVLLPRLGRILRLPRRTHAVRADARRCLTGAFFLALVLVVVNFFRDNLFALYLPTGDGALQIPFTGPGILENLLLLNLWLGVAIARELFYARAGERKATLGLDIVSNVVGLFCLLRIVATRRLVDFSAAQEALGGTTADGVGALLNTTFVLLALATATILAAHVVERTFRIALLQSKPTVG